MQTSIVKVVIFTNKLMTKFYNAVTEFKKNSLQLRSNVIKLSLASLHFNNI